MAGNSVCFDATKCVDALSDSSSRYAAEQSRRNAALRKADADVRQLEREQQQQVLEGNKAAPGPDVDPLELSAVPLDTSGDDAGDYYDDGPDDYDDMEYATVDATGGGANIADGINATLPDFSAAMPEAAAAAAAVTFEDLVRQHIEQYMAETQKYVIAFIRVCVSDRDVMHVGVSFLLPFLLFAHRHFNFCVHRFDGVGKRTGARGV